MNAYDYVVQYLEESVEVSYVSFVGPACRTWYTDLSRLRTLISDLYSIRSFEVLHGGKFPFDMYVEEMCKELSISCSLVGPVSYSTRLAIGYERDQDIASVSSLVVAFPREDADLRSNRIIYPPESADLGVVRMALSLNIPVFSVYRDGRAEWSLVRHTGGKANA